MIAGFDERRAEIVRQLQHAAARAGPRAPIDDDALLDEVTALVERPNVLLCRFEPEFLAVPPECLILTMKANQKYFPLLDAAGRLTQPLPRRQQHPARPTRAAVIEGNERVVRPRLADAKFFFDQDRKKTLESRVPGLDKVVYHGKLGTQGERVERVRAIARAIARSSAARRSAQQAERAALLAKADLLTDMVGEFPELQGVMGGYYARHDGEADAVAVAIEDHYKPRFAGDALPRSDVGIVVALADKLETLVGLFGIGQLPTGDKDPFALRRHALGVIRMLVERDAAAGRCATRWSSAALRRCSRPAHPRQAQAEARLSRVHAASARRLSARARLQRAGGRRGASSRARRAGPRCPKRLAAVRAVRARCPSGLAGRGQQARRQHPEEERRRRPAQPSMPRCWWSRPSARCTRRSQTWRRRPTRLFDRGDYTGRCRRWRR